MKKLFFFFSLLCFSAAISSSLGTITSATLVKATLLGMPNCLSYEVKGSCFWSQGYSYETTLWAQHYVPELAIIVFNKAEDNPWIEINKADVASSKAEKNELSLVTSIPAGSGQFSAADVHENNVRFKCVDIIGNPGLSTFSHDHIPLISAIATPMKPYYFSTQDALMWRGISGKFSLLEEARGLTSSNVGSWGSLFPREGEILSENDLYAGAVTAFRAANIVNDAKASAEGHLILPGQYLGNRCGEKCDASSIEPNGNAVKWQMVFPEEESFCHSFGDSDDMNDNFIKKVMAIATTHESDLAYVWILWRKYNGCIQGDGKYVGRKSW